MDSARALRALGLKQGFYCPACRAFGSVDEDGCCSGCGVDTEIRPLPEPPLPLGAPAPGRPAVLVDAEWLTLFAREALQRYVNKERTGAAIAAAEAALKEARDE